MSTLQRAIEIAVTAHAGQTEDAGQPYVLHPLRLMFAVEGTVTRMAAVLHDTVEDTSVTLEELEREGFPPELLAAVRLLTRPKGGLYSDYVVALSENPVARAVKLADLRDNSAMPRSLLRANQADKDYRRLHRYYLSYKFLTGEMPEADYRGLMADAE